MQKHMGIFIEEEVGFRLCDFARQREVSLSEAIGKLLDISGELPEESVNRLREFSKDYEVPLSEAIDELLENWNEPPAEPAKSEDGNDGLVFPPAGHDMDVFQIRQLTAQRFRDIIPAIKGKYYARANMKPGKSGYVWRSTPHRARALEKGFYFLLYDKQVRHLHVLYADREFFAKNQPRFSTANEHNQNLPTRFSLALSAENSDKFKDQSGVDFSRCFVKTIK